MLTNLIGAKVLIADGEHEIVEILVKLMQRQGLRTLVANDGESALECVRKDQPDLLLVDYNFPGKGIEVMRKAKALDEHLPVILITGFAHVRGAVEAIRAGAHDYLAKPFENHEVVRVVQQALAERSTRRQLHDLSDRLSREDPLRETLGPSDAVSELIADVARVAKSNFSVIILGETGSGKEVIARAVHQASLRSGNPFIPVDCGAIPEPLLESELFGHERGAFTGASQQKPGRFETARGGTLFLDEVSNLPWASQAKLLRVLQDRVMYHVGGSKPLTVDARLLSASNESLQRMVDKGSFRRDLYFRLNEFVLQIPPLRRRREDIPYLASHFMEITNVELGKHVKGFTRGALDAMLAYEWPGNVRQLRSTIRRAVLIAEDSITPGHLSLNARPVPSSAVDEQDRGELSLRQIVRQHTMSVERDIITQTLHRMGGNKARAARTLKVDYKTLHSKVREYGIESKGEQFCEQ